MRTPNVLVFHETVTSCFDQAIRSLFGETGDSIYHVLTQHGITKTELSDKFENVEIVLNGFLGVGARSIMTVTLENLCKEYSLPLHLDYASSLGVRFRQVVQRVLDDKLFPKSYRKRVNVDSYFDNKPASERREEEGEAFLSEIRNLLRASTGEQQRRP